MTDSRNRSLTFCIGLGLGIGAGIGTSLGVSIGAAFDMIKQGLVYGPTLGASV